MTRLACVAGAREVCLRLLTCVGLPPLLVWLGTWATGEAVSWGLVACTALCGLAFAIWSLALQDLREARRLRAQASTYLAAPPGQADPVDIDTYALFVVDLWLAGDCSYKNVEQLAIMSMGLTGEAGEVMEHHKKFLRDGTYNAAAIKKELGDVLYYLVRICAAHGFKPSDVIRESIAKLSSRKSRGTLQGSGDNR